MRVRIRSGHVIDPGHGVDRRLDVYVTDGVIATLGEAPAGFKADVEIDAGGKIVCPGLVDLCARVREPGLEHKATMESELRAAAAGGITSLCLPPDTLPAIDTPAMARFVHQRAQEVGHCRLHPLGALTRGLGGERLTDMAALKDAGCVGVGNGLEPVRDTLVMRRALQYAATFDLTVFLYAQDPWLTGNGCVHEGEISTRLGLPAIPEAAETVGVSRELALIETTGARCHFLHLSSRRAVDLIAKARADGLPVSASVTAHHLHLCEHDIGCFNTDCHVLPPLRGPRDRDRLVQALREGDIVAVCSDHQPHEADAKLAPLGESEPGISGLETLLPLTLKLTGRGGLSLAQALALLTCNPARILGLDAGHLAPGAPADICIFDPEAEWTFDRDRMLSRGHNTPFHGWPLTGGVTHTVVRGRLVYEKL
jgi:dihydroorotase